MKKYSAEKAYLRHNFLKNIRTMLLFVLILLLIILLFGYVVQRNEMRNAERGVGVMTTTLNREVDRLYDVLSVINESEGIRQIKAKKHLDEISDYYGLTVATTLVTKSFANMESVENYFLSFGQNGLVLSNMGTFLNDSAYYLICNFPIRYVEGESDAPIFLSPCPEYRLFTYTTSPIPTVVTMQGAFCLCAHFVTPGSMNAVLVIKDSFIRELYPYAFENSSALTIRANDGTVLYSYGTPIRGGVKWKIRDSGSLFTVEASFSLWTILARLRFLIITSLILIVAGIGLCLALAWRLTRAKYVTIRPIIGILNPQIDARDDERLISSYIDRVNADRDQRLAQISVMRRSLKRNVQMMLLNGVVDLPANILSEFPKSYRVVYGYMKSATDSIPLVDRLLLEQLLHEMPGKLEPYYLGDSAFAFVYPATDAGRQKNEELERLSARLSDDVQLVYSAVHENPEDACRIFEEMRRASLSGLWPEEAEDAQPIGFRHMEELYQSLSYDEVADVRRHIVEYIDHSLNQGKPLREVYLQVCGIVGFAAQTCGYEALDLQAYSMNIRPQALIDNLLEAVADMCDWRDARRQRFDDERRQEIISYISAHLSDQNLTAQQVGEVYGLSEHAVQTLVKNETNMSFAAYLQRARLEKSLELLASDAMPVYAISEACGFSTLSTFQKAFKRMYDIAPGEWRKRAQDRAAASEENSRAAAKDS